MDWKEVFKVSLISGIVVSALWWIVEVIQFADDRIHAALLTTAFVSGLLATSSILDRRLKKSDDWGIYVGMVVTFLLPIILVILAEIMGFF